MKNSKLGKDLLIVLISILAIAFIAGSLYLGSVMSPILLIVIYLLAFNFFLVPMFVNGYYWMHEMDAPGIKAFIPLYNVTLVATPALAIISNILVVVNVIMGILFMNVWVFEGLGDKMFFIISDGLPLACIITVTLYYIVAGIGLAKPALQVRDSYLEFFRDEDEIGSGFVRFLVRSGGLAKYFEAALFILPVFRILPMFLAYSRVQELKSYNVEFSDFN